MLFGIFLKGDEMMKKVLICVMVLTLANGAYAELKEHWRLDESSGGIAHNGAGYIDGLLQLQSGEFGGGIWQPTEGLDGALELQNNERVLIAPSINLGASWTVMGWIKPANQGALDAAWNRFMVTNHLDGFYLGFSPTNNWSFLVNLSGGGASVTGSAAVIDSWQHVAGVYDAEFSTMKLYVNGVGFGPATSTPPAQPDQAVFIGSDYRLGDPSIIGLYDDCAIYNEALDGAAILNIYQEGLAGRSINYWQATNPSPADNDIDQPVDVTLNWTAGSNPPSAIANHILYYGTDPNCVFNSNESTQKGDTTAVTLSAATTNYSPPDLTRDMIVYWRVDEKIDASTQARGALWEFSTELTMVITQQPRNQRASVDVGDSVTFSVEATSDSPMSYQWYKDGSPIGADDPNLVITDIVAADEGEYYVVITNDVGSKASDIALLLIKGLLGHWPMEGNANDISGYGNNGTLINDPNFVTGISGQAVRFDSASQQKIEIPNEAHFDLYDGFTASFWMNAVLADQTAEWATMLSKGGNNGGWNVNKFEMFDFISAHMDHNPDLANNDTPTWTAYDVPVFDNAWHLVNFAYDGTNEYIYIDGNLEQSGPAIQAVANDIPVVIGASRTGSVGQNEVAWFNGLIDDVRIYNYALSPMEIGQLYYDVTGTAVCVTRPQGDTDGDCDVDLADFALLAADWLGCGLVPDSQCP